MIEKDYYNGWNDEGNLNKILSCPFCGGNGELLDNGYEHQVIDENGAYVDMDIFEGDTFWIECEKCGAMMTEADTPEKAIEEWNKRTGSGWIPAVYEGYLDKLKMIKPDEIEKVGYEDGLKDAFYAAKMIEFDVKEGGIGSNNLMKIFGYSSLKSIIFNFKPKEIVEKIKEYEKDKKVRVGDVLRNKRSKDFRVVFINYLDNDEFESIEISPSESISFVHGGNLSDGWEKTGEHYDLEKIFGMKKENK